MSAWNMNGKYKDIYNRIRYLISQKGHLTCIFLTILWKSKVNFYNSYRKKDWITVTIHKKSVLNKNKNNYYKIFLEKCFYQLAKK